MAGNTATLQIKVDVDNKGTVTLGQVSKSLNDVDAAARKASTGLVTADKGLGSTSAAAQKATTSTKATAQSLDATDSSSRKAASGLGLVSGGMDKLVAAAGAYLTLDTAGKVIGMADSMSVLGAKVGLVTDSEEEYVAVQQQLYAMSQITQTEIGANTAAFAQMDFVLDGLGKTSTDTLQAIDLSNKTLKLSGATTAEAASFQLQLSQALRSGVVQWEELGPMLEANAIMAVELGKAFDTDVGGLKRMTAAGELTSQMLADAFPKMADSINASFGQIPMTIEGAMTQVSNAFKVVIDDANIVTDGTSSIAEQISGLAVTVQANAPAIEGLFSAVVTVADAGVRSISGLTGVVYTVSSALSSMAADALETGQAFAMVSDYLGVTDNAAAGLQASIDGARDSAVDLAGKASSSFGQMLQSTEEAKKAQQEYQKSIEGNSKAVLADIDAQKKREKEHSDSVQKMSNAEQKAADERAKVIDEMHKAIGGEDYYKREADKVLAHVEVLKKAGATQEQQAQYTYEKIAELSAQAWKKGETAAGEYLDQIKSTMADAAGVVASTDLSSDITADSSQLQAVAAQSKQELDALGNTTAVAGIEANASQFDAAADSSRQQAAELEATTATVEIGANTAVFDGAMQAVKNQVAAVSSGTMAVNTQSEEDLREALAVFEENPQLDPDGSSRKKYQKLLAAMPKKANWFVDAWAKAFSFAGGGYTWDGQRSGGVDGIGGRQVLLHPQETVVDHLNPDRAAIVSLYDKFVAQGGTGSGSASTQSMPSFGSSGASSISTNSQRGSGDMQVGTINVHIYEKTNYDELIRAIRRRAIR